MCAGKAGLGQDAQGKVSFVKDGEGELICFRHMNRSGQILHLPMARPSSEALWPLWGSRTCPHIHLLCQHLGTCTEAGSSFQ